MSNSETGNIERKDKIESQPGSQSRYRQTYLNQGRVEQALIDHLESTGTVQVEWEKEAESLKIATGYPSKEFPVAVEVRGACGQSEEEPNLFLELLLTTG